MVELCRSHAGTFLHASAAQKGQATPPGSKACGSLATQWNHQHEVGGEGAASKAGGLQLALRPPDRALLPGTWCNAGYKITYNQAPRSTGSSGHWTDLKFHHDLPAPKAVAVHLTHGEKVLGSPSQGCLPPWSAILLQPAPAFSARLCTYTCQVVQSDTYKALSNA